MRIRPVLISLLLLALLAWGYWSRTHLSPPLLELTGSTMGTTYSVRFPAASERAPALQAGIDSLLQTFDASLSTYSPSSILSRFNASTELATPFTIDEHIRRIFAASVAIHRDTEGAFNPAVGPLVRAWGFGPGEGIDMTAERVDSLRALTDLSSFHLTPDSAFIVKTIAGSYLDFNAIAPGYAVDLIGEYLLRRGIEQYFVEIGGEVVVRGLHPEGRPWRVGIERPIEDAVERTIQSVVLLEDAGLATSGNYRKYIVKDGQKYGHTIDPHSGYPAVSTLLSATVIAPSSMLADGYATAAMVMGADRALEMFKDRDDLEMYLIVSGPDSALVERMTPGFERLLARDAP